MSAYDFPVVLSKRVGSLKLPAVSPFPVFVHRQRAAASAVGLHEEHPGFCVPNSTFLSYIQVFLNLWVPAHAPGRRACHSILLTRALKKGAKQLESLSSTKIPYKD
jgi:hypothetical protein